MNTPVATASVRSPAPSKGPPPLPASAAPAVAAPEGTPAEESFFVEGVDGHAESLPSSVPDVLAIGEPDFPPMSPDDAWLEPDEEEEAEVEDPARTRRRRAARIGVAWGAVAMFAIALVAVCVRPRGDERAAASSTGAAPLETMTHAPVATPALATAPGPTTGPVAAVTTSSGAIARVTSTSGAAAARAKSRPVRKAGPSSPATRAKPTPSKAPGAHATRAPAHPAARPAATPKRR